MRLSDSPIYDETYRSAHSIWRAARGFTHGVGLAGDANVPSGAATGTVVGRLMGSSSDMVLSIVSGPFTLTSEGDLKLNGATGLAGSKLTARIKAERSSPFLSLTQDLDVDVVAAVLGVLTLSATTYATTAAPGEIIATIAGKTAGSTLTIRPDDGRLVLDANQGNLVRGLVPAAAGVTEYTITETIPGVSRSHSYAILITDPVAIADYVIEAGGWEAFWATHGGAETSATKIDVSGKVIDVRGDQLNAKLGAQSNTGATITFSSPITIRGRKNGGAGMVEFVNGLIGGGWTNIRWQNIDFHQTNPKQSCWTIHRSSTNVWGEDLIFRGISGFDLKGDYASPANYALLSDGMAGYGIGGGANTDWDGLYLTRVRMEWVTNGFKHGIKGKTSVFSEVHWRNILSDAIGVGTPVADPAAGLVLRFCTSELLFANASMNGGPPNSPHSDHFQWQGSYAAHYHRNIVLEACVFWIDKDKSNGAAQNIFIDDINAPWYVANAEVAYCILVIPDMGSAGVSVTRGKGCVVYNTICVRENPGLGANANTISFSDPQGDNVVVGCVAEGYNLPFGAHSRSNISLSNTVSAYQTAFPNVTGSFKALSLEDIVQKYGSGPRFAAVDWVSKTIDYGQEDTCVFFETKIDLPASSTVTSNWTRLKRGPVICPVVAGVGVRFQFADDDQGTNATGWKTEGAGARGKYIRLESTSPAGGAEHGVASITINGHVHAWELLTASIEPYSVTRFAGAKLENPRLQGVANTKKMMVAWKFKPTQRAAISSLYGWGMANTRIGMQMLSSGHLRITCRDVTGALCANADFYAGAQAWESNWAELFITVDMTKSTLVEGMVVVLNGQRLGHSPGNWIQNADLSWTDASSFRYAQGNNTTTLYDHDLSLFYVNSVATLDVEDPVVRLKFAKDLIGDNGEGPTGAIPAICIMGDAASINAGAGNVGTGGAFAITGAVSTAP